MNIRWSNVCLILGLVLVIGLLIHGLGRLGQALIRLIESVTGFGGEDPIYGLAVLMALAITLLGLVRLLVHAPRSGSQSRSLKRHRSKRSSN
ncbi:MAG: hypothetical protein ACE37H_01820 [Phycisphaeraceae bacterium]